MHRIIFLVKYGNIRVFTFSLNREDAKRTAHDWIGGNADKYIVEPLTDEGDRIILNMILYS